MPVACADPRLYREEAWRFLGRGSSVHLQLFPESAERFATSKLTSWSTELLKLRGVIGQAIEKARQEKLIGNALEAAVILRCDAKTIAGVSHEELEEFFILSDLKIETAAEPSAVVTKTEYKKCARCWRHRSYVGTSAAHPDLCDRCEGVVSMETLRDEILVIPSGVSRCETQSRNLSL